MSENDIKEGRKLKTLEDKFKGDFVPWGDEKGEEEKPEFAQIETNYYPVIEGCPVALGIAIAIAIPFAVFIVLVILRRI